MELEIIFAIAFLLLLARFLAAPPAPNAGATGGRKADPRGYSG